jgi:hypothetical protein
MKTKSDASVGPRGLSSTMLYLLFSVLFVSCAASAKLEGPTVAAPVETSNWSYNSVPGTLLKTDHYNIYTTEDSPDVLRSVPQVMEGALGEYQKIAPGVPLTDRRMDCYLFGNKGQWIDFTRRHTGAQAGIYLQINRGGYTIRDWYVSYYVGDAATYSVAAHEGWHQFVSRHFKGRLPPFLEEGIATMFEDIHWKDDLPEWNLGINRTRVQGLRRSVEGKFLFPLSELVGMHAGNVVNQSGNRIEAFYSQDWAFATFLWTGENAKYRPALRQLMSDTADGTVFDPTGVHKDNRLPWSPQGVRPMLEHYLGMNLDAVEVEYLKYIHKVAFDDYAAQWN